MNVKIGVIIGAIVVLLLGAGAFLKLRKPSTSSTAPTASSMASGTLKSLFASNTSQKCTFNNKASGDAEVTGTIYAAGGKVRGDFQGNVGGSTVNSHVIVDSQTFYVWTDMSKQGFKFALTDEEKAAANGKVQGPDLNQTVDYSCQGWTVDNSVFVVPADITFTSFTIPSPLPSGANGGGAGMSLCSVCNNIPAGPSQDSCKAQYHCQ